MSHEKQKTKIVCCTGWLVRILILVKKKKSPHNWVVFHPLTLNNPRFLCSLFEWDDPPTSDRINPPTRHKPIPSASYPIGAGSEHCGVRVWMEINRGDSKHPTNTQSCLVGWSGCLFKTEMVHDVVQLDFGVFWHLGSFCIFLLRSAIFVGQVSWSPRGLAFGVLNVAKRLGTNKRDFVKTPANRPQIACLDTSRICS